MIVNIWSTPRTGSNWYSAYLLNQYQKTNKKTFVVHQYLNFFHLINYGKFGYNGWLYEYVQGSYYPNYTFNHLKESIELSYNYKKRERNEQLEEDFRIELFEKHNAHKNPIILHSHVAPMSLKAYQYLFYKANKNIFLYRENFLDQISSYALGYGTNIWKSLNTNKIFCNIDVDRSILESIYERIKYWHTLDKTNCEIIRYEDLNFSQSEYNLPKKQNLISSFNQLSKQTQNIILELNEKFNSFVKNL